MEATQQMSPEREAQQQRNQQTLDLLFQMRAEGDDIEEWRQMQLLLPQLPLSLELDEVACE